MKTRAGKRDTVRNRPAIERLIVLARLLRLNGRFTTGELAKHFETGRRTITRDLEFLRDRLGYEYEYRPSEKRFVLLSAPSAQL